MEPHRTTAHGRWAAFALAWLLLLGAMPAWAQTVLYSTNFGTTAVLPTGWSSTNTTNGWNASTATASSGYSGASGSTNILFAGTGTNGLLHTLNFSNNLSTVGYSNITVLWGGRGGNTFAPAVVFEWSSDGTNWNPVAYTYTNNATWALVNGGVRIALPSAAAGVTNLRFRWTSTSTNNGNYRIDDFSVQGTPPPTIADPSETSLSGFSTIQGVASTAQQFTISGSNLTADLVVTAPDDYEVRDAAVAGAYAPSVSFTPSSGTVSTKTIDVRIAASAAPGNPAGDVTITSTGAGAKAVAVEGVVTASGVPFLSVAPTSLAFGDQCVGSTSDAQEFVITGSALTTDPVEVGPLAGYLFQDVTGGGVFQASISIAQAGGAFSRTIAVAFAPALAQAYNAAVPVDGGGASTTVAVSGNGLATPPTSASITGDLTFCAGSGTSLTAVPTGGTGPYTYLWSNNEETASITVSTPGTYSCLISDVCGGVMETDEVVVVSNALPTVSIAPTPANAAICGSGNVALVASGAASYTWAPGTGLSGTTGASVTATPATTTTYTVTGTDGNGCQATAQQAVSVGVSPVITSVTATPNPTCSGGDSQLTVNMPAPAAYCPSIHTSGCGSGGDAITNVVLGAFSNPSGCVSGNSPAVDYTALAGPVLNVSGNPHTISITMGSDGSQYAAAWVDFNQDGDFADAGEFLGASGNVGASGTANIVFPVPAGALNGTTRMRVIGGNDNAITTGQSCTSFTWGETEDYSVIIVGGVDAYTYAWSPADFLTSTTVPNPVAENVTEASQAYTVTVTNAAGCSTTGNVTVTTTSAISAATISGSLTYCVGGSTTLTAVPTDGVGPFSYLWSNNEETASITVSTPGTYSCLVEDACGGLVMTNEVTVTESPLPVVVIAPTPSDASICNGSEEVLLAASGAVSYTWAPATGLSATTGANVAATPTATTTYTVTGTDANGCQATAQQTVGVGVSPQITTVTAVPETICPGGTSQLGVIASQPTAGANTYVFSTAAGFALQDMTGATELVGPGNTSNTPGIQTIGFTFNFGGVNYTQFSVSLKGVMGLGATAVTNGNDNGTINARTIMAGFDNMQTGTDGGVYTLLNTSGGVGQRIRVVEWRIRENSGSGTYTKTMQAWLYEGSNQVRLVYGVGTNFSNGSPKATVGIASAPTNYNLLNTTATHTNTTSTAFADNAAWPGNGRTYLFTPAGGGALTFEWTPADFLNSAVVPNPVVQDFAADEVVYTVAVTNAAGCSNTSSVIVSLDTADDDGDGIPNCQDSCPDVPGVMNGYCQYTTGEPAAGFSRIGILNADCQCIQLACTEFAEIDFTNPSDDPVSWQLVTANGGFIAQSGEALYNTTIPACVPAGEYRLVVSGMPTDGSYVLRSGPAYVPPVPPIYEPAPFPGDRVIDNIAPVSGSHQVATYGNSGAPVQLPQGEARLLYLNCDKTWWKPADYIVANELPAVAAEWIPGGSNAVQDASTGYDFWFYDPNGGYSFVRQRRHNQADNYANVGSGRTCHARLTWPAATGPALPVGVMLNVRVRAVVNGVAGNWGPACRFELNPDAANCVPTSLIRQPDHTNYSCGVVRKNITHNNQRIFAQPVSGANRYQFTFAPVNPNEGDTVRRTNTTYYMNFGWAGNQLQNNTEYNVWVRASKDGGTTWCEEETAGFACRVYICNNPPNCGGSGFTGGGEGVNGGGTGLLAARDAQLRLWPNPNRGDQLWLNLAGMDTEVLTVSVDILDLSGKRVVARELALQQGPMALELNNDLAAGTYLVTIVAGEQRFMERLVIQH